MAGIYTVPSGYRLLITKIEISEEEKEKHCNHEFDTIEDYNDTMDALDSMIELA